MQKRGQISSNLEICKIWLAKFWSLSHQKDEIKGAEERKRSKRKGPIVGEKGKGQGKIKK